jgi:hypothetical protein
MATVLTFPERVTEHNMPKLKGRVLNGSATWPGANFVGLDDGARIWLRDEKIRRKYANELKVRVWGGGWLSWPLEVGWGCCDGISLGMSSSNVDVLAQCRMVFWVSWFVCAYLPVHCNWCIWLRDEKIWRKYANKLKVRGGAGCMSAESWPLEFCKTRRKYANGLNVWQRVALQRLQVLASNDHLVPGTDCQASSSFC